MLSPCLSIALHCPSPVVHVHSPFTVGPFGGVFISRKSIALPCHALRVPHRMIPAKPTKTSEKEPKTGVPRLIDDRFLFRLQQQQQQLKQQQKNRAWKCLARSAPWSTIIHTRMNGCRCYKRIYTKTEWAQPKQTYQTRAE